MKDEKTGEDLVSIGFVVDLDYADATSSAHDFLQQFKTHPMVREILEGGERVGWGAKAIPARRLLGDAEALDARALLVGDAAGMVNLAALKGIHYAIKSGILAAEEIYNALKADSNDFSAYEQASRGLDHRQGALRTAQHPPAVPEGPASKAVRWST